MGKKILAFLLVLSLFLVPGAVIADECADKPVGEKVGCYEAKLQENLGKQKTLANTISYLDNKISLKRAEIGQTEEDIKSVEKEIVTLSVKIGRLDVSLTDVSELLISRVGAAYKRSLFKPIMMLFSSKGLTDFFERNKYLQTIQLNDRKILLELQTSRDVHQEQKDLKQQKQEQLEGLKTQLSAQRVALGGQKQEKQNLLAATRNDEKRYQALLADAQRERQNIYNAFLSIPDGERVPVKKGDVLGSMGSTGFSTGPHLHFSVYHDPFRIGDHENPTSYLNSKNLLHDATACDDTPSEITRPIGSGSYEWPMSDPRITQCYGHTPWSWMYSTNFHNGVDMVNKSNIAIRATDNGEAIYYRGGQSAGNGVFIFHDNGKMTLYWHLQ